MRVRGLRMFMADQQAATLRHFQAALALQPDYALPSAIATPGSELHTLYTLAKQRPPSTRIPFADPKGHRTLVNGTLSTHYVAHVPNIIQSLDKKDQVSRTFILEVGERLPTPYSRVVEPLVETPTQRPKAEPRPSGTLLAFRPGLSFGSLHRFYAEGLRGDGNTGGLGMEQAYSSQRWASPGCFLWTGVDSVTLISSVFILDLPEKIVSHFTFQLEGRWQRTSS